MKVANHIEAHTAAQSTAAASNKASQTAESSGSSFLDSLDSMMAAASTASQQAASAAHKSMVDASGNNDADGASNAHAEEAPSQTADATDNSTTNVPAKTPLAVSNTISWASRYSAGPIVSTGSGNNMVKGKLTGDNDKSGPRKTAGTDTASSPVFVTGTPVMQPVQWSLDPQSLSSGSHTAPIAVDEQAGTIAGSQPAPSTSLPIMMGPVGQTSQPDQPAGVDTTGPQNNTFDPTSQPAETAAKPTVAADPAPAAAAHEAQETAAATAATAASILDANALSGQSAVTDPGAAALASQALAASMSKNFTPAQNAIGAANAASAAKAAGLVANNAIAKPGSKNPIQDNTDLKSDSSVTVESSSQSSNNAKSSTGDHTQHDANSQQQAAVVAVPVVPQHTADTTMHQQMAAFAHTTEVAPSASRATTDAASSVHDHAAEAAATAASTASNTSATTPSSSINTARLIQSVGQSEMRVGMRSAEFGDISIRTSATHNSLSAQISLEHTDLANALTAHLPDMHARLGGNGNVDVRVNNQTQSNTSQSGSQGNSSAGNSSSNDGSRNRGQQTDSNAYSQSRSYNLGQQFASVPAALAATGVSSGRLSIQA